MANPSSNDEIIENPQQHEGPVEALMRLTSTAQLLRSTDGRCYAKVKVGGRREIYPLRSAAFRRWLTGRYYRDRHITPSDWAIRRILGTLESNAWLEGDAQSIFIRVGHDGRNNGNGLAYELDLADPSGQVVEIGPEGWSVVNEPRAHFRRPAGHLPLPTPSRGGSIELLRPYVNLNEPDFRLLIVWMAAALRPVGPYPILALYGEQGSTKSTLAKVIRLLIDPRVAPLVAQPRDTRALMVSAVSRWVLAYDNISVIPDWLSDGLCLLATGGAFEGHTSFTNDEESAIQVQRPVILTGIEEFVGQGDLSDRSVLLNLPPIAPGKRRLEREFWHAFEQDYPRILGGLLDAVVGGLHELPSVRLTELPRMADFAAFAEAVGRKLGWPAETVLSDYRDNRRDATVNDFDDSPLATCVLDHATELDGWFGTATDLLALLTTWVGRRVAASPRWPKSPKLLAKELRRLAPQLRIHDMSIAFERNQYKRLLTLTKTNRPKTSMSPVSTTGIDGCVDDMYNGETAMSCT